MKKQLNQLRRFFARTGTRKLNAATAREAIPASYDDDDNSNRLSGAFIVVLALHVIALVGVFAFSRMKDPKPPVDSSQGGQGAALTAAATNPIESGPATPQKTEEAPVVEPSPASAQPAQYASLPGAKYPGAAAFDAVSANDRVSDASRPNTRAAGGRTHVVKSGDNLTKISVAYNVGIPELRSANKIKGDEIKLGQELNIPEPKATRAAAEVKPIVAKPTPSTYRVRKNDTLVKIARHLGVPYDELEKLNNIKDPRKIQEGQTLKVPKKG